LINHVKVLRCGVDERLRANPASGLIAPTSADF
jgi:hypothetical protein